MEVFNQYIYKLRSSGLRPTRQRLMISKLLFGKKETFHFTIENLSKLIEKNFNKKISLATIYNTVNAFKKIGYLKEIPIVDVKKADKIKSFLTPVGFSFKIVCISELKFSLILILEKLFFPIDKPTLPSLSFLIST